MDPESLINLAHKRKVGFLSITDHDCLDAIPRARKAAENDGMTLISGVELNTEIEGEEVHILGFNFDPNHRPLVDGLANERRAREARLMKMLALLNLLGFDLSESRVREIAGKGAFGRPHLARALIEKKIVKTVDEAFRKFLGYKKPAWVPRSYWTPHEAITLIHAAGGKAVLAHPGRGGKKRLADLAAHGLDGIEVYYPSHTHARMRELLHLAKRYGLFVTVGSDYHGINPGEKGPGSVNAPQEVIESLVRIFSKE